MPSTVVIVPTYNEIDNIAPLAQRLLALEPAIDVVCVDDASPDGTGEAADTIAESSRRFHVVHRTGPRGYAKASAEGMSWALAHGYALVCTMDADLSHDPADLPRLAEAVRAGADLAIGSRYVEGGELAVEWGPVRRAVSRSGSRYARAMLGTAVKDCTSGFRCYRATVLEHLDVDELRSEGYSFLIELLGLALADQARVVEIPIRYLDRRAGASKISRRIVLEALRVTTGIGLRRAFGRR